MATTTTPTLTATYQPTEDEVRLTQQMLKGAGLYAGEVTGVWDQATYEALREFQRKQGLGESGQIDLATTAKFDEIIRYVSHGPMTDIDRKVYELYGPAMAAYLNHPEIGPILRWAAAEGADEMRLRGYLERTNWWRQTSESSREWDKLTIEDPETTDARRRERLVYLTDLSGQLGIGLDDHLIHDIAETSLRLGLSDSEIRDMVVSTASFDPQRPDGQGNMAVIIAQLRDVAKSYYLHPSDQELFGYAKRITGNELTLDAVKATFATQAKVNHPFLARNIDEGSTVEDFFAEHKRRIAAALEVNEDSIDLMDDPKWWPVLGIVSGKDERRPMTWGETMQYINGLPEAKFTRRMNTNAAELASMLHKIYKGYE